MSRYISQNRFPFASFIQPKIDKPSSSKHGGFMVLLVISAICAAIIEGQPTTQGFISIDCGAPSGTTYKDSTGIFYVSDDSYIETGKIFKIDTKYTSTSNQASTLRSFPNGTRNCYTLRDVTKGAKYLVRATFLYGNYDGKQIVQSSTPLQFDLYIDVSLWRTVNITDASSEYSYEVVTVASNNFIWVCLVDIKAGTPFISALELRPLRDNLYPYAFPNQSNAILFRLNYGPTNSVTIRYPDDPYDRLWPWYQYDNTIMRGLNTTTNIARYSVDNFEAPISVLQTALTPVFSSNLTLVSYDAPSNNPNFPGYYVVLHMTELQELSGNQSRQYDVYLNDVTWFSAYKPPYCKASYIFSNKPQYYSHFLFKLVQLRNSTLPPILNGMEVYWPMTMEVNQLTSAGDGKTSEVLFFNCRFYIYVPGWKLVLINVPCHFFQLKAETSCYTVLFLSNK
ncbi:hypothetical protein LUZ61_014012 [Rhynchospora tenuis]|uniref:Malectin-like domain-containing protein n=1 Tax=Rhynchospora tenuis TaxID=198213 RepID=A0AAD5Z1B2_9POAL|nr:hypothetical protein LUZ61_014012 [Rhynchospora tenuis]